MADGRQSACYSFRAVMSLRTLWYYVTSYSGALGALAAMGSVMVAFIGELVASIYAYLTWRLGSDGETASRVVRPAGWGGGRPGAHRTAGSSRRRIGRTLRRAL